jgi:mannose-6-phosphate isomerase
VAPGLVTWPTPIDDFVLHRADLAGGQVTLPGHGPRIVLCLRGEVRVADGAEELVLTGGQAAFGVAGRTATVAGSGEVYQATTA